MTETSSEIESFQAMLDELQQVGNLLKKDTVIWPYQKMDINEFWRKYFPESATTKEIEKYKKLAPEKLLKSIENKLRTIDAILKPLEDNMKALEFQHRLLSYLGIYAPNKLKECQKVLKNTPREIRESFTSEKNLDLAIKQGLTQKSVAELMALWLNMRYYGALSGGLSPKFLITTIKDEETLKTKLGNIDETLNNIRPNVEGKHADYSTWVLKKQRIDDERKIMTFGPESIQTLEVVLNSVYHLSINGEISQEDALEVVNLAKQIIDEAIAVGETEKKTLVSKEKREKLEKIITEIKEKPRLFFTIAQISKLLEKGESLTEEHIATLDKIKNVVDLLPATTIEAIQNEELQKNLQIIFEPLKFKQLESEEKVPEKKEKGKKGKKKKATEEIQPQVATSENYFDILKQIFDDTAKWCLNRIVEEKKTGLENLLELFNGIPLGLGNHIALLITKKAVKLNVDSFKECLIGYLSKFGVYELYTQIGKLGRKVEAEIQVADEINIPPQADQRLAPLQKQIKFEFMKYMETAKLKGTPLFNILELHQVAPIKFVDLMLEKSQFTLINIINSNAEHKLHQLMNLDPAEYDVKLKTLNLKLSAFIKSTSDLLEKLIAEELKEPSFRESEALAKFNSGVEDVWLKSLIEVKKIEPKEVEITTDKVSALAAQLEGGIKKTMTEGPRAGPPSAVPGAPVAAPPSARPGPPSAVTASQVAAPPSARPGPPSVATASPGAAPPSARAGPPSVIPSATADAGSFPPDSTKPSGGSMEHRAPGSPPFQRGAAQTGTISAEGAEVTGTGPPSTGGFKHGTPSQVPSQETPSIPGKVFIITKEIIPPKAEYEEDELKESEGGSETQRELQAKEIKVSGKKRKGGSTKRKVKGIKESEKVISDEVVSVQLDENEKGTGPQPIMLDILEGIESSRLSSEPTISAGTPQVSKRAKLREPSPEITGAMSKAEVPEFVKTQKSAGVSVAVKTIKLKETIEDVMGMIESSMAEIDQLSPEILRNALQLVYRLRELEKMDVTAIDPGEVRKLADLAEALRTNKTMIVLQKEKLKKLETKLSETAISALDSKLELIAKIFDEFIEDLEIAIVQLTDKGEKLIQFFQKKGGKEFRERQKIRKEGKTLAKHVDILARVGQLSPKEFEKAKAAFIAFQKARVENRNALVKQYSKEIVDLIGIDRDEFLKSTRDSQLIASLQHLFKLN